MAKIYKIAAWLMFITFMILTGSYLFNRHIDTVVENGNKYIEQATQSFNDADNGSKLIHNFVFANCFPNVCGRVSFITLGYKEELPADENGEVKEKFNKVDLFAQNYILYKFNPIEGYSKIYSKPTTVVAIKNNEKLGHVSFDEFTINLDANLVKYYALSRMSGSDVDQLVDLLAGKLEIKAKNFKLAEKDLRVRLDDFSIITDVHDLNENTISKNVVFDLKGLTTEKSEEKLDVSFELSFDNFSKDMVRNWVDLTANGFKSMESLTETDKQKLLQDNAELLFKYLDSVMQAIADMPVNKTQFNLPKLKFVTYTNNDKKEVSLDVAAKGKFELDEKLNPVANIAIDIVAKDDIPENVRNSQVRLPSKDGMVIVDVFEKVDNKHLVVNINADKGKLKINQQQTLDINGMIADGLKFAQNIISMMKMSVNHSN